MAIAGHVGRRLLKRVLTSAMEAKRAAMETLEEQQQNGGL
jgi:hypothetical protein